MADYLADPLWHHAGGGKAGAMIPLDNLPLSQALKEALRGWARRYDTLMDTGYDWPDSATENAWVDDGQKLLDRIRAELGPEYEAANGFND